MADRVRTEVEDLFLREMVEEDRYEIMREDNTLDDIIPTNTNGLFDDVSSSEDDIDDILDDEDIF